MTVITNKNPTENGSFIRDYNGQIGLSVCECGCKTFVLMSKNVCKMTREDILEVVDDLASFVKEYRFKCDPIQ